MNTQKSASTKFRHAFGVAFASVLLVATASGQTLIDDDFAGTTVNTTTWFSSVANATTTVNNGITFTTNPIPPDTVGGNGSRNILVSNATNINPFAEALTFTFSGLTLTGGAGTNAAWGNAFFASVGRVGLGANPDTGAALTPAIANTYYVTGGVGSNFYEGALGLNIRTNNGVITLSLYDRGTTLGTTNYTLDAMPTDVVWTIDGTGTTATWSVSLTGATIEGGSSVSGTFSNFNAEDLIVGDESVSRLAFGAYTIGNMDTNTVVTLDGVSVGVIPEPSSFALIFAGLIGAVITVRRRSTPIH